MASLYHSINLSIYQSINPSTKPRPTDRLPAYIPAGSGGEVIGIGEGSDILHIKVDATLLGHIAGEGVEQGI